MDTYHRWMEVIPISLIGLPALSVPVGFGAQGLPMGMQLAGPVGADARGAGLGADVAPRNRLACPAPAGAGRGTVAR